LTTKMRDPAPRPSCSRIPTSVAARIAPASPAPPLSPPTIAGSLPAGGALPPDPPLRRGPDPPREPGAAALARDDRGIAAGRAREAVHHRDRIRVLDRHEGIGRARQYAPGERRGLVAFEHCH